MVKHMNNNGLLEEDICIIIDNAFVVNYNNKVCRPKNVSIYKDVWSDI